MTTPPVFDYRTLDDLGAQTYTALLAVWLLRHEMDFSSWVALLVRVLIAAILQAEQWGRLYGQVALPVDGQALVPTDGVPRRPAPEAFEQRSAPAPAPEPVIDYAARDRELTERLDKAVRTVARQADTNALERLARDEPIQAAQRGYQDGLRLSSVAQDKPLRGYRRGINPDCCELCYWLYKEGFVYDLDQPMHRHIGCRCVPVPTTDPYGKWRLSAAEQAVFDDLYDKYSRRKS